MKRQHILDVLHNNLLCYQFKRPEKVRAFFYTSSSVFICPSPPPENCKEDYMILSYFGVSGISPQPEPPAPFILSYDKIIGVGLKE